MILKWLGRAICKGGSRTSRNSLRFLRGVDVIPLGIELIQPESVLFLYRVTHLVANLGWVDLDLGCSTILLGQ